MALDLLDNIPIDDLTENTDFFGHLQKAEALKDFFKLNIDSFERNKMFALFGEWGSGKSTILKYLEKNLKDCSYVPIFFEAWQYEKDDNLALSLIDKLKESIKSEDLKKELLQNSFSFLKALSKGITIKTPLFEYNHGKVVESAEADLEKKRKEISFHSNMEEFKNSLLKIETKILEEKKGKKIIVFIDDLDRCEPENVLNLISAIKLFFTYGKDIIFLFGIDKKAVGQAVEVRYGKTVHSETYLEKVFDVSFNMPKEFYFHKLIHYYFPQVNNVSQRVGWPSAYIERFLKQMDFTTPRHLKKVLNKFIIIQSINRGGLVPETIWKQHQNVTEKELIYTVFVLFFIILHEFHHDKFVEIENYEQKINSYMQILRDKGNNAKMDGIVSEFKHNIYIENIETKRSDELVTLCTPGKRDNDERIFPFFQRFLTVFSPKETKSFQFIAIDNEAFLKQFDSTEENKILLDFCEFLMREQDLILRSIPAQYRFWNLFAMAKALL